MASNGPDPVSNRIGSHALARWSRPAQGAIGLVVIFSVVATLSWIVVAWAIAHCVAVLIGGGVLGVWPIVGLLGVAIRALAVWLAETMSARAGRTSIAAARDELISALSQHGADFIAGEAPGARTSQLIDRTARIGGWSARWMPGTRLAGIGPMIVLVAVAAQSWLAAAILAVSVFALPVFIWLTASATAAAARAQQASLDSLSGAFQARAAHAGIIRAFRAVTRETETLRRASRELADRTMAVLRIAFLTTGVLEFFSAVSIALVAVYVGFKLLGVFPFATGEELTLGQAMMVLVLAPEFFAPIRKLSSLHHDRADAAAAAGLLATWLARTTTRPERLPRLAAAPTIRFEGVGLSHAGAAQVVSGIDFEVQPGEMLALAGPSGSGKTLCLLALLGLMQPSAGRILIDGKTLNPGESLADSIGYVRQLPWITEGALADNLRLARPDATQADMLQALKRVGALHLVEGHARGLDRPLARFGGGISGGERQRLALARALLRETPVLLLDEPTAHLDPVSERDLLALLRDLAASRTVIVATHRPAAVAAAHRVVRLPSPAFREPQP